METTLDPTKSNSVFKTTPTGTNPFFGPLQLSGEMFNEQSRQKVRYDLFSALWQGEVLINVSGEYSFGTSSDDGSAIFIDQNRDGAFELSERVVDNSGTHGTQARVGSVTLATGTYPIAISFVEFAGGQEMEGRHSKHLPR